MKTLFMLSLVLLTNGVALRPSFATDVPQDDEVCQHLELLKAIGQASQQKIAERNARLKLLSLFRQNDVDANQHITFQCEEKWWWHCTAQAIICQPNSKELSLAKD